MRTKQRNNLAETARHERVAQNTDVYAVKARNYKGLRRGSPVLCRNNWHIHHAKSGGWLSSICCNYYFGGRYDGKDNLNFFDRIFNAFYFRVQFLSRGRTTAS